jgi:hypothetical protein
MPRQTARPLSRGLWRAACRAIAPVVLLASGAAAQTDYYNTDAGRPIRTEDAYPVERRAVELQLAPLRLERARGGLYTWAFEPELALGLLPQTQFELGLPLAYVDATAQHTAGLAGVEVSALHNFNVETRIPALAIAGDLLLPVGGLGPDRAFASVKGIATKTFRWARFHLNGAYTFGDAPDVARGVVELSRWGGSVAVDRTLPLRSLLVTGEVVAEQPIHAEDDVVWSAGGGARWQYSPRLALDAGLGGRLTGDDRGWYVTFGSAYAFGLPWTGR